MKSILTGVAGILLLGAVPGYAQADGGSLGPRAAIPSVALPDQSGKVRKFEDIRGPKGAMLVFYRSADW